MVVPPPCTHIPLHILFFLFLCLINCILYSFLLLLGDFMSNNDFVEGRSCFSKGIKILEVFSSRFLLLVPKEVVAPCSYFSFQVWVFYIWSPSKFNWNIFLHNLTTLLMFSIFLCSLSIAFDSASPNIITLFLLLCHSLFKSECFF